MKNKKIFTLAVSLLLGGFAITSLAGCEGEPNEPVENPGVNNPGGETPSESTYTVSLNFDNALGTVTASKDSGKAGETVKITITPNEDATIKSITINGESKEVVNSFSFVTKEGVNTVAVVFEKIDKSFTVALEYDEEYGKVEVNKTKGDDYSAEDSVVSVKITPYEHYKVGSILVNGQERSNEELEFTFVPQQGYNLVKVVFMQMSNFDELSTGFNIDTTNFDFKGTPDFNKEEFLKIVNSGLTNVKITDLTIIEQITNYSDKFFDEFVSTYDIKKVTLEKVADLLKDEKFNILIQMFTADNQDPGVNQFELFVDLVSLLVNNFEEEEFVKIMYMGVSFFQFAYTGISYSAISTYSGLSGSQIEDAEKYFRSNNNVKAADELASYINASYFNKNTFGEVNDKNAESYLTILRALYQMLSRVLTINTGETSLGLKIQNLVQFISTIGSADFLKPENYERDYETLQFLAQIIKKALPSYKSFKRIFEILDENENIFKFLQDFVSFTQEMPYVNGTGETLPAFINDNSESVYYILKYLAAFIDDLTLDDYKGAMALIGEMLGMSQETTIDYYTSSVKLSKLIVNNLVNYGADAEKIKDYLAEGIYLYFYLPTALYQSNVSYITYGTYKLSLTTTADLHTVIDKNRVIEFINKVSTFDGDNLTEENKKYIDEFIKYFQENVNGENPIIKYNDYFFTVNHEAKVGTDLLAPTEYDESETTSKNPIYTTEIENFNKEMPNKGLASINIAENLDLIIPYNRYLNGGESIRLSSNNEMLTLTSSMLAINQNIQFSDEDALVIYDSKLVNYDNPPMEGEEDPSVLGTFKFKDLNLDLTTTGTKYAAIEYAEGKAFYFAYYVYAENDIHDEYGISSKSYDQFGPYFLLNIPGQISSPFRRKYITFELNGYEYEMTIGDYEYLNFKEGEYYYVDTSKAGHFVEEIELDDGTKMSIGYSVYDPKGNVEINTRVYDKEHMDSYGRYNFEYQNLDISGTYIVDIQIKSQFINDDGSYKSFWWSGYYDVTADDFENKLDNTTPGPKTDTLNITLGDKVYKFDYEYTVNKAMEGNDTEYYWNFASRDYYYIVGFGYSSTLMMASKAKEQYFIDNETGKIIDKTTQENRNNYLSVNAENIEIPNEAIANHEKYAFVEFTSNDYPERKDTGKVRLVYEDEYEIYDSKFDVPYDGQSLDSLLEQEYFVIRQIGSAQLFNIYDLDGAQKMIDISRLIQIPTDDIRDQLEKNGTGNSLYLNVNIDGVDYLIEYSAY